MITEADVKQKEEQEQIEVCGEDFIIEIHKMLKEFD